MSESEKGTDIHQLVSNALKALQDKNLTQARIIIDEALSFNQPVRDLQFVRGLISLEQGRYEEARGALQAELEMDPSRADVRSVVEEILPLFR
jgi:Tfp pilus assembly protein PilF